ncbi:MAG: cytochrome c3 family protein [Acidobacteria bacterium]|nr:cytochrome c3 family protein [Acidobacteriota bacterium]MBI3655757.1 cytochrome c3 family protein [Acidobacteriota bacterium]
MKAIKLLLILVVFLALGSYSIAQYRGDGPKQTVVNSLHDLRNRFTGATLVCEFCHFPHKTDMVISSPEAPLLWNVRLKTGPYTVYGGSSTFYGDATVRDPSRASRANSAAYMTLLCLSCHDGTVTQAAWYDNMGLGGTGTFTAPNIGHGGTSGLSGTHPLDFVYSAALATLDGGVKSPTEGGTVRIPYVGTPALPLFKDQPTDVSGRVECATCHNPHSNANGNFLRMSNAASALCLNCHGV